ncbi:hypothetical protein ACFL43_06035 [Thermodesulfobacteriota bacterium]
MKKLFVMVCAAGFLLLAAGSAGYAGESKTLFVNKCGSCHRAGGEAEPFAPTKFASYQWKKYFERDRHKRRKDISGEMTVSERAAIQEYLVNHAADSERPEAIGLSGY